MIVFVCAVVVFDAVAAASSAQNRRLFHYLLLAGKDAGII